LKRGADGRTIVRLLLFLALAAPAAPARAAGVDEALSRARELRLWERAPWLRLGHWRPTRWLRRWDSDAGPDFFLAPDGARDPRAELEAEVRGLFAPEPGGGLQHPRCRFPARAAWLEESLGLDAASLPPADCSRFEDWKSRLDARAVTLIFASSYMDNPSSMFGHTFLRLERSAPGEDRRLLDNTLNFAADTGDDDGVSFALKGLLGLYPGTYTVMPYYMKVAEYNDIENRDLWEYRLALSSAEVDRLAAHAWELGPARFPYYFFSRNCSYQLMPVLEAAAPRLSLLRGQPLIVAPAETVRAARAVPGLVADVRYRPAHGTVLVSRRRLLTAAERRAAEAYAAGKAEEGDRLTAALPSARRALVLDSAQDVVLYRKGYSPDVPDSVRAVEHAILVRRARVPDPPVDVAPPDDNAPPDEGHDRHRLELGQGWSRDGAFTELGWRTGYHELVDRPQGYSPGAEFSGFSWRLRYDEREDRVYVRDLRLVDILSASPWDSWTRKPSWSAGTGLDTAYELGKAPSESLVYEGHVDTGLSARLWPGALAYALAGVQGAVGAPLRDGFRAGGEVRGGLAFDLGPSVRAILDGGLGASPFGDKTPIDRLRAAFNWSWSRDFAWRAEAMMRGHYRESGLYAGFYY
jgi:hypothetical protein